ncbi:MAG: hypothetical protein QX198_10465, partial [Methylococcaceae bacterium]
MDVRNVSKCIPQRHLRLVVAAKDQRTPATSKVWKGIRGEGWRGIRKFPPALATLRSFFFETKPTPATGKSGAKKVQKKDPKILP